MILKRRSSAALASDHQAKTTQARAQALQCLMVARPTDVIVWSFGSGWNRVADRHVGGGLSLSMRRLPQEPLNNSSSSFGKIIALQTRGWTGGQGGRLDSSIDWPTNSFAGYQYGRLDGLLGGELDRWLSFAVRSKV